jgi:AraC-like DNA-binding protein
MDFHKGLSLSIEEVKKAHLADEAVQSKYGVVYHQFWVNEIDGTVFCLMEGPDKESCAAVHQEAHGGVACSIIEVAAGFYKLLMGEGHIIEKGHVKNPDGSEDKGLRHILVMSIEGGSIKKETIYSPSVKIPNLARELAMSALPRYHGREVKWLSDRCLVAVFHNPVKAVQCAIEIQNRLIARTSDEGGATDVVIKMGLCSGQPVTEEGEFFTEAIRLGKTLCQNAKNNEVVISSRISELCELHPLTIESRHPDLLRILNKRDESFLSDLYKISEAKLSDENFTVDALCREIGTSRPQLYRKIISLTGKSPIDFIRDLRMEKALSLIKKKETNISEIALEVGYHNPSYFAKCFYEKYGCKPSRFAEANLS